MNKKEIIKYLKETDLDIQAAKAAAWACFLVFRSYAEVFKKFGIKNAPVCCYISYDKSFDYFYQILRNMTEVGNKLYKDYLKNKSSLDKKIREHLELTDKMDKLWKQYENKENQGRLDSKELLKFYNKFFSLAQKWWYYGMYGEDKGEVVNLIIVPNFQKRHKLNKEEAKEIVSSLAHPDEMAVFNQERILFLEICQNIIAKKNRMLEKNIDEYLSRFFWFRTDFYEAKKITREYLINKALLEIKKRGSEEIKKEIKTIKNNFRSIRQEKESVRKRIKLKPADKKDIYFAQNIFYWFDQRKLGMMSHFYYLFSILQKIADLYNLDYQKISLYHPQEVEKLLKLNKKISSSEIKKRRAGMFVFFEAGKTDKVFYGKEGQGLFDLSVRSKKEELKGTVASAAGFEKVQGMVKIVSNPSKTSFNKGEILVTSMTRIEFVPLMRKAKAIITNEGGMACHAAIVSRELGIPAVIGTKSATRILKDGDKIEMNMRTGEITVLRK